MLARPLIRSQFSSYRCKLQIIDTSSKHSFKMSTLSTNRSLRLLIIKPPCTVYKGALSKILCAVIYSVGRSNNRPLKRYSSISANLALNMDWVIRCSAVNKFNCASRNCVLVT